MCDLFNEYLMTNMTIESINFEQHRDLCVKQSHTFEHAQNLQFAPINADELAFASTCYPLFFIKDQTTANFFPIALFGLEKDENLFYSTRQWGSYYIPKSLSISPFSMARATSPNEAEPKWVICLDRSSPYVSADGGEALYEQGDDKQAETPYFLKIRENLTDLYQGKATSLRFIERLVEGQLLKPAQLTLDFADGEKSTLDGLYTIDQANLKAMPIEHVQEFHEQGYFQSIYSMMNSQHNLYQLVKLKQAKGDRMLRSVELVDPMSEQQY